MLGKLIKHDFHSLSKVLLPAQIAILGATIIATAGFAFNIRSGYLNMGNNLALQSLRVITAFLSGLMIFAIFAAMFLVAFIIFQRFYKSFMCDEGYLTFTLPVTTNQLLWSKLITAVLWSLINSVVVFLCVLIFIAFGTSSDSFFNAEAFRQLGAFIAEANRALGARLVLPIIECIIMIIVGLVYNTLEIYLSIIIGGQISQKHKILAAIGAYFGINIVVGIVSSVIQTAVITTTGVRMATDNTMMNYNFEAASAAEAFDVIFKVMNPIFIYSIILCVAMSALFFFVSHYLLKNKLNLE